MATPSQLLQNAKNLLNSGQLVESLALFQELTNVSATASEGYYGIGFIKYKSGDLEAAALAFRRCVKADANHANASYFLGLIAEAEGQPDIAQTYFQRVLAIQPQHKAALEKYRPTVAQPSMIERPLPANGIPPTSPGFYAILQNDTTPLARQTLQLIDSLRISSRPRLSAYLGRMLLILLLAPLILLPVLFLSRAFVPMRLDSDLLLLIAALGLICAILCLIVLIIRVKSRLIVFDQGRIQIIEGVFSKNFENIELYRIRDMKLHQTLFNRLTGDGSLILFVEQQGKEHRRLQLRGLEKKRKLDVINTNLRDLVLLLRSGNWGKGVIY